MIKHLLSFFIIIVKYYIFDLKLYTNIFELYYLSEVFITLHNEDI